MSNILIKANTKEFKHNQQKFRFYFSNRNRIFDEKLQIKTRKAVKYLLITIAIMTFILVCCDDDTTNPNETSEVETVTIGSQVWMLKNLDVDHYRNGDPIRHCVSEVEWLDVEDKREGAWCYFDNDLANGEIYGKLYNGFAVNDPRGLASAGWHIPSDAEWKELEMCLGMTQSEANSTGWRGTDEGGKAKDNWHNSRW